MVLQNRHVLVGRGVEHHLGSVPGERLEDSRTVGDVDQSLRARSGQCGGGVVEMGLVVVEQDKERRFETAHLAADLGTDRPTGTRHQHPASRQRAPDRLEVGGDRCASEQVLDPGLAGLAERGHVGRFVEHVLHAREDLHRDAGGLRRQ